MWRQRSLRSASWQLAVILLLVDLRSQEAEVPPTAAVAAPTQSTGSAPAPAPALPMGSGFGSGATDFNAWPARVNYHRPIYTHQNLHSVLASIDERLRALDALYSSRYAPRLDLSADTHPRRLDGIETRLGRLETLIELRLDKVTETLSSRQLKDELAKDQLSRAVDAAFERLHHRLSYVETRLDVAFAKLQGAVAARDSTMQRQFASLTSALGHMQEEINRTLSVQNDGGGSSGGGRTEGNNEGSGEAQQRHERHITDNLLGAVDRHAASFGSKVTNMYNELWRRTQILEGLTKDSMALTNATRRELQEGMRSVSMQLSRYCSLQADKAKPTSLSRDNIEATLEEIRTSTSSYFQTIISIQHMFQASCHRIQEHEPMLEKYLAETLERIVELLTNNKWENQVEDLHRYLKSHHTTVVRNVGHTTNTVLRAANYSSKEAQNLAAVINEAYEGLLIGTTDIQKGISRMQNEHQSVYQSLKEITAVMNELQSKVSDLSNRSSSDDTYMKVIRCPEKNSESSIITSEFKRMFEANQKHVSKEIQNITQSITDTLRSIGVNLTSLTLSDNSEPSKKDFVNVITVTGEDYHDNSEHNIISEAQENLISVFDSYDPQTEKSSVLQNFPSSHSMPATNKHGVPTLTPSLVETNTPQHSKPPDNNSSSQEHTINILPNTYNEIRENQLTDNNEPVSNTIQENKNNLHPPLNNTLVKIVHNTKPLMSEGQLSYFPKDIISTVMSNLQNKHSKEKTFTNTAINFTGSEKSEHNKNHALNEMTSDNPTTNYHDINSNLSSRIKEVPREYKSLSSYFQHKNAQNEDLLMRSDHYHHSNINRSLHQVLQINTSQHDSHVTGHEPNSETQNLNNHSEQVMHQNFPNLNRGTPRNTRHKTLNKNDAHYLYRLLNKLEKLSNRLMNSENSDISVPANSDHIDDSQEGSVEYQDYSLPDSSFSSQ